MLHEAHGLGLQAFVTSEQDAVSWN